MKIQLGKISCLVVIILGMILFGGQSIKAQAAGGDIIMQKSFPIPTQYGYAEQFSGFFNEFDYPNLYTSLQNFYTGAASQIETIAKKNVTDDTVKWARNFSVSGGLIKDIAYDSSNVYHVQDYVPAGCLGGSCRRISLTKRSSVDGSVIWTANPNTGNTFQYPVQLEAADNYVYLLGYGMNASGPWNVFLEKRNASNGNQVWIKYFANYTPSMQMSNVVNGDIYLLHARVGSSSTYVEKIDTVTGDILWTKTTNNSIGYSYMVADATGVYFAANQMLVGGSSVYVRRFSKISALDGALLWDDKFNQGTPTEVTSIFIDGQYLYAGSLEGFNYSWYEYGRTNYRIEKINASDGVVDWRKIYIGPTVLTWGRVIGVDPDGVYSITTKYPGTGIGNGWVFKTNGASYSRIEEREKGGVLNPIVTLTVAPGVINKGEQATLSWTVANATSCWATSGQNGNDGGWTTTVTGESKIAAAGTYNQIVTPPMNATYPYTINYNLECWNGVGLSTGIKTVAVTINCASTYSAQVCSTSNSLDCSLAANCGQVNNITAACWAVDSCTGATVARPLSDCGSACVDASINCPLCATNNGVKIRDYREVSP